jgi:exopolysaccharide production protein ExoQ
MNGDYGRVDPPGSFGNPWPRHASGVRAEQARRVVAQAYSYLASNPRRPITVRRGARRTPVVSLSLLYSVLLLLLISVTLRQDDIGEVFGWQVAVRFLGYSLAALSVVFALGRRRLKLNGPIGLAVLIPALIAVSALYAPEPTFAFAAGFAHLSLLLFAWRLVNRQGAQNAMLAIVIAGTIVCALSIFVFYAFPEIGQSALDSLDGDPGGRMRGVTTQPNLLGEIAAITVLMAVMLFRTLTVSARFFAGAAIFVAAFCVIYSDSRTSIVALLLCLGLWWLYRANAALNLLTIVGAGLLAAVVNPFTPDLAAYLTRAGARSDDLASLNGRSYIWQVAWEHINAHPLIGHGYGASRTILPTDDRLFAAAVNTHNLYLELLFSGGIVLLGLFVAVVAIALMRSVARKRGEALIAMLFFLMVGGAEASPFSRLPLFAAFAFYTALSMCLAPSMLNRRPSTSLPRTPSNRVMRVA